MKQIERIERNIPSGINRGNNREIERERKRKRVHNDRSVLSVTIKNSKNMRVERTQFPHSRKNRKTKIRKETHKRSSD